VTRRDGLKIMKTIDILLCGLGGQGILFMTKLLARTAMDKGLNVMGAETHGMAQRGGSVVSHLRLGETEGSLVRAGTSFYLWRKMRGIEIFHFFVKGEVYTLMPIPIIFQKKR
jgi:hypothetical protein